MKRSHIATAVFLAVLSYNSNAATVGAGSSFDSRIQRIEYNPDDVIKVLIKKGTASVIQFAQDEKVTGIGLGDPEAWNVSVRNNFVFFRPQVDDNPDTNVAIVTNKRNYSFDLISTKANPTYLLRFSYPKPASKNLLAESAKQIPCTDGGFMNGLYEVRGDASISPYQIWDDGRFTCLRWKNTKDLPIAYRINSDGDEFLVNTHMDNNTMVIHEIAPSFILRLGKSVLEFRTNSHVQRRYNYKGTTTRGSREEISEYSTKPDQSNPAAYAPTYYPRPTAQPFVAAASTAAPAPMVASTAAPAPMTASTAAPAPMVASTAAPAPMTANTAAPAPMAASTAAPAPMAASTAAPAPMAASTATPAPMTASTAAPAPIAASTAAPAPMAANTAAEAVAKAVSTATAKSELWVAPTLPNNPPITAEGKAQKKSTFVDQAPTAKKAPGFTLIARSGESWEVAFERWIRDNGFSSVVWYYPEGKPASIKEIPAKQLYSGDNFFAAIVDAENSISEKDVHVTFDHSQKIAIIHNKGTTAQAFKVSPGSLSENALRLAKSYGWNSSKENWLLDGDQYVSSGWVFATKGGDIQEALNNLFETFSVQGQLLKTTKQVYFVKENQ